MIGLDFCFLFSLVCLILSCHFSPTSILNKKVVIDDFLRTSWVWENKKNRKKTQKIWACFIFSIDIFVICKNQLNCQNNVFLLEFELLHAEMAKKKAIEKFIRPSTVVIYTQKKSNLDSSHTETSRNLTCIYLLSKDQDLNELKNERSN